MTDRNYDNRSITFSNDSIYLSDVSQESEISTNRRHKNEDETTLRSVTNSGQTDLLYQIENRSIITANEVTTEESSLSASGLIITLPPPLSTLMAPPPYNLDPPSYATVLRPGETRINANIIDEEWGRIIQLLGPSAPFIAPKPPPTYNQAQGLHSYHDFEELVEIPDSNSSLFRFSGVFVNCPTCMITVQTETHLVTTKATHCTALLLFLLGCWPCCLLPYCMPYFKTTLHFCPICGHYFGLYAPLFSGYVS